MIPSLLARQPAMIDEPEHEQRVREDRADDRGLRDHDLARREREDDDEELGQVTERRLEDPGHRRTEPLPDLLGRERDEPGEPGERERREDEGEERGRTA